MEPKRIYRSNNDKMLCGVCGGVAEYLNVDPTVVRLIWVIFGLTVLGIFAYIAAAVIMPIKA